MSPVRPSTLYMYVNTGIHRVKVPGLRERESERKRAVVKESWNRDREGYRCEEKNQYCTMRLRKSYR